MKNNSALGIGLAVIALLSLASANVKADPDCYKRYGYGLYEDYGTRSGCGGEGGVCFWMRCDNWNYNDDCFSWVACRPDLNQ